MFFRTTIKDHIRVPPDLFGSAGDRAAYYETTFELLTFRPELQEVLMTKVRDIAEFGAFMTIGPADGMIHISQTMDDYVSFSKDKVLTGKESNRSLRVNDKCKARVVAVSYKDITNPKIGLTMRQDGLGRLDWVKDAKAVPAAPASGKTEKSEKKQSDKKAKQ